VIKLESKEADAEKIFPWGVAWSLGHGCSIRHKNPAAKLHCRIVPKSPNNCLRARGRSQEPPGSVQVSERLLRWEAAQTAIIICDMWDSHTCNLSAQRVAAMAPRMNQVISASRSLGVMIITPPAIP